MVTPPFCGFASDHFLGAGQPFRFRGMLPAAVQTFDPVITHRRVMQFGVLVFGRLGMATLCLPYLGSDVECIPIRPFGSPMRYYHSDCTSHILLIGFEVATKQ